jgi:5-hydroxyisourate hydrolase-like protein (transthyretin family)
MSENECRSTSIRITVRDTYVPPKPKPPIENREEVEGTEVDLINQVCEEKYFAYGYVYNDLDEDRSKDENEGGADKVEVNVYVTIEEEGEENEYKVQKLTTDNNGRWEMQLCEGTYDFRVNEESLPTGVSLIDDNTQTVTVDQDLDEAINFRYTIDETLDRIVNQTCQEEEKNTLSGYVYNDQNKNGEKDDDEAVAEGVEITIYYEYEDEEYEITTVVSNEEGYFEVNLCEAEYIVRVDDESLPDGAVIDTSEFNVDMTQDEVELSFTYTESEGILNFLRNNCLWIILAVVAIVVVFLIGAAILRGVGEQDEQEEF